MILALEVFADDVPFETAQDLLFRLGRAYPAYWEKSGEGRPLPVESRVARRRRHGARGLRLREPRKSTPLRLPPPCPGDRVSLGVLLSPLVLHHGDKKGGVRYRQLEYYRMPYMTMLALDNVNELSRADCIRLALGNEPAVLARCPIRNPIWPTSSVAIATTAISGIGSDQSPTRARFMASGHTLVVVAMPTTNSS